MFQFSRDESARVMEWEPHERAQYIEAWKYSNESIADPSNFRHGLLNATQIKKWLEYEGEFAVPARPSSTDKVESGLRLLICDRTSFHGLSLGLSSENFHAVESAFELHPATLPAFAAVGGTFSRHVKYSSSDDSKIEKVSIILKAPQKYEIANYTLSLTYNTATQWTTAMLTGESVVNVSSVKSNNENRRSPFTMIRTMLSTSIQLWNNPFLLPSIIMTDHLERLRQFCNGQLTEEVMAIEDELGVTRAGRRDPKVQLLDGPWARKDKYNHITQRFKRGEPVEKSQVMELTIAINTQFTKVLFSTRSPIWNHEASDFLLATFKELQGKLEKLPRNINEISELLEHNIQIAKSVESHVVGLQTRLDIQLNVLYSFVAQTDNRLSARLAATSGRDSTSMKILAFITTLFLPGTFVATLFSMSMFNWQYSSSDNGPTSGGSVVSSRFWIYWVVTAPLTLLTLLGWSLWWNFEKNRYDIDVAETLRSTDRLEEPTWWRRLANKKNMLSTSGDEKAAEATVLPTGHS